MRPSLLFVALACIEAVGLSTVFAAERDFDGLPLTLPGDYLQRPRVVPLPHSPDSAFPLPAAAIEVNGKRDLTGGRAVFEEQAYAQLLPGTAIEVRQRPAEGGEQWDYPVGAESLHEIRFQATEPAPFELRIARLIHVGRWATGSYRWENGQWNLNDYEGLKPETFQHTHPRFGAVNVSLKRINLKSCKGCHATQVNRMQFPSRDETGPCGFVPENSLVRTDWAELFIQRLSENPFRFDSTH